MRAEISRAIFHMWPFQFGHVSVMEALKPPPLQRADVTTRLKRYGLQFRYDPNSYLGKFIYYRGIFEEQILRSIERDLRRGTTFIDVGANVGLHTVVAADLVGAAGTVIAFEPGSTMRARVQQNLRLNGLLNVDLRPYALGRARGSADLYVLDETNDGESTLAKPKGQCRSESVEIRTMDDELSNVNGDCVVKIDVEGAEMEVLLGAAQFVRRVRPRAIFVECVDAYLRRFGGSRREVIAWLHSAGYETRALVRGRWIQMDASFDRDADIRATPRA
jgi:FkbM family methyltransferase